jgi:peptidyl-prolyl cis-trans isomerase D
VHHALDTSPAAVQAWANDHKEEVDRAVRDAKNPNICRTAAAAPARRARQARSRPTALLPKAEARKKIDAVLDRVRKGEDFAKVARQESDDSSAAEGGDLGCFQRGSMVKPFEDAAYALAPGEISPVVESQYGFHVIKLDAIYKDADAEAFGRQQVAKGLMETHEAEAMAAETAKKVLAAVKSGTKFDTAVAAALPSPGETRQGQEQDSGAERGGFRSTESDRPRVEYRRRSTRAATRFKAFRRGQSVARWRSSSRRTATSQTTSSSSTTATPSFS